MSPLSLRLLPVLAASSLAVACGDSETNPGSGGTGGTQAGAGGQANGGGGQTGSVGGSGPGGGSGGSAPSIEPDPLKNCEPAASPALPALTLTEVASGLASPVYVTQARGDDERLFVVEKPGTVRIVRDGVAEDPPFLDIGEAVSERSGENGEMGLLGFAFHPDYLDNGRFYVHYSTLEGGDHIGRISEFTVSMDRDLADASSEQVLIEVNQPEDNHNGGGLEFGRDGFLYISLGDGGGGGDNHGATGNGQNLGTLLGKILRIDVDGTGAGINAAYAIPAGNFDSDAAPDEIWSYGWRNPWRFSFDACTGDMYVADVGQDDQEEVNFEPALTPGRNYGWRLMEGDACFNPESGCQASSQNLVLPVATYGRDLGISITGGYVYRGSAIPDLRGTYLYADYGRHRFFALRMEGGSVALEQTDLTADLNPDGQALSVSSFGQDNAGELYVVSLGGTIYRLELE